VLDVKTGSGAFMKKEEDGRSSLPNSWSNWRGPTGQTDGRASSPTMKQPLGHHGGNALEVAGVHRGVTRGGPVDLREPLPRFGAWMFHLGGASKTVAQGKQPPLSRSSASGRAFSASAYWSSCREATYGAYRRIPTRASATGLGGCAQFPARICDCDRVRTGGNRLRHSSARGPRTQRRSVDSPSVFVVHKKVGDKVSAGSRLHDSLAT